MCRLDTVMLSEAKDLLSVVPDGIVEAAREACAQGALPGNLRVGS